MIEDFFELMFKKYNELDFVGEFLANGLVIMLVVAIMSSINDLLNKLFPHPMPPSEPNDFLHPDAKDRISE